MTAADEKPRHPETDARVERRVAGTAVRVPTAAAAGCLRGLHEWIENVAGTTCKVLTEQREQRHAQTPRI